MSLWRGHAVSHQRPGSQGAREPKPGRRGGAGAAGGAPPPAPVLGHQRARRHHRCDGATAKRHSRSVHGASVRGRRKGGARPSALASLTQPGVSSGEVDVSHSDFLVPSEHPDRTDLARGRNAFVSATAFLNTVSEGGHLNFALSDNPKGKQMVKKGEDGRWSFYVQVGVKACETGTIAGGSPVSRWWVLTKYTGGCTSPCIGLNIAAEEGKLVFYYNIPPNQQDTGEPDTMAFYQFCNPIGTERCGTRFSRHHVGDGRLLIRAPVTT